MPALSLCMIVKNEVNVLRKCLESAKSVVSQIVIVDTGSTDKTLDIAREFNAEIHSFDWMNDFSAARNEALKFAKGDWILHLDADEQLMTESLDLIPKLLTSTSADAINLIVRNWNSKGGEGKYSDDPQIRLFRNRSEYRYQFAIHEQIGPSIEVNKGKIVDSDIVIDHYGYADQVEVKARRNLPLIEKEVRQYPHNPYFRFKLAETQKALGLRGDSLENYIMALHLDEEARQLTDYLKSIILMRSAQLYLAQDNFIKAVDFAGKSLEYNPENDVAAFVYSVASIYRGELENALKTLQKLKDKQSSALDQADIINLITAIEKLTGK